MMLLIWCICAFWGIMHCLFHYHKFLFALNNETDMNYKYEFILKHCKNIIYIATIHEHSFFIKCARRLDFQPIRQKLCGGHNCKTKKEKKWWIVYNIYYYNLRKKAVTGVVSFQKVHLYTFFFNPRVCILVPWRYILALKVHILVSKWYTYY